jgi:hypothetical protein
LLTALAAGQGKGLSPWLKWPARLLALLGALLILPEYPFILAAHADPELRPALILGAVTILGVVAIAGADLKSLSNVTLGRPSRNEGTRAAVEARLFVAAPLLGAANGLLAFAATIYTARSLVLVWPELAALFNAAPGLNWGPVALGMGMLLVFVEAIRGGLWRGSPPTHPPLT